MRLSILLFGTMFLTNQVFSQTANCDQLNNYVSQLKTDSTKLQKEVDYIKETLKIFKPIKTASKLKIDFNLLFCEGDTDGQTVTLTINLINTDVNKNIQFQIENFGRGQSAIDVQGNAYNTENKGWSSKLWSEIINRCAFKSHHIVSRCSPVSANI